MSVIPFIHCDGGYSIDASDLGLAPGDFPPVIAATLEDGRIFHVRAVGEFVRDREGDLLYVVYNPAPGSDIAGSTFKVWND